MSRDDRSRSFVGIDNFDESSDFQNKLYENENENENDSLSELGEFSTLVPRKPSLTTGHSLHYFPTTEEPFARRSPEHARLITSYIRKADWKSWGPYLSERAWGTVREDYSNNGNAWNYLPHDHARSCAYRWNEDGLGGFSNRHQNLCLALAFWNGKDPILKERLFGLTGPEGNHGEDVKELYYYVDGTPTHSYMKMIYKYPIDEYPYSKLVEVNRNRSRLEPEFELYDACDVVGRHFHITIEYFKTSENDISCCISARNSSDSTETLHILPHLWARNTWSWGYSHAKKPHLKKISDNCVSVYEKHLKQMYWYVSDSDNQNPQEMLFTENETNYSRLYNSPNPTPYRKDAFHNYIIKNDQNAVNPQHNGTKCAAHFKFRIGAFKTVEVRFRLNQTLLENPFADFLDVLKQRRYECDLFYEKIHIDELSTALKQVQRQALAGMLWNKQYYHYGVDMWLNGDPAFPPPAQERNHIRNQDWRHFYASEVLSMPDKWEYPWFAAWDLAFHCIPIAMIDPEWAKRQLVLILREWYMHPSGQIPAYEWNFGDVNPPVHAWAVLRVYQIEKSSLGISDTDFLEKCFHKLLINFTWWVNRKDAQGHNLFEGGFLGLDNIGIFDRSNLPPNTKLEQADSTAWMAMYCLNMLSIALELARTKSAYEDVATKFLEHFFAIAKSISQIGGSDWTGLWDEESGFFYDFIRNDLTGEQKHLKIRSFVGLIPLFAVAVIPEDLLQSLPSFKSRMEWLIRYRPELIANIGPLVSSTNGTRLLTLLNKNQLERVLSRVLDEEQFLSPFGLRSLSKEHQNSPYSLYWFGQEFCVQYEPGESPSGMFGGNSNWRGPIWFPVNMLMIEGLNTYHRYFENSFQIECPTRSGNYVNLHEAAFEISRRLLAIFCPNKSGHRPVNGKMTAFSTDQSWRDYITFSEYFHGDTGAGLGASHQTGWTGLVAFLCQLKRID